MKPKPKPILELLGSKRALKDTKGAVEAPPVLADPPKRLSAKAKRVWREVAPILYSLRILADVDTAILSRYCEITVLFWKLRDDIRRNGTTQRVAALEDDLEESGFERERPQFKQFLACQEKLQKIEAEFGMTPSARTRIRLEDEKVKKTALANFHDAMKLPKKQVSE